MRFKSSNQRREILLFPPSLEEIIASDNIVRLIDAFVDTVEIEELGFKIRHKGEQDPGAPQYHPTALLKIYIYGYLNRLSSSRQLERACKINIEMMWLVSGLQPGHVTINSFRKDNPEAIKSVFRAYNRFLNTQELFGKETIAIDSSKFRAQNAKRNNHNERSLKQKAEYLDKKTKEYLALLERTDQEEGQGLSKEQIKKRLEELKQRKQRCTALQTELASMKPQGETQISTVDKDARKFKMPSGGTHICTNIQSAVDDKHMLIADYEVTNKDDKKALSGLAIKVKKEFKVDRLDVLADGGYPSAIELKKCADENIITYVSTVSNIKGKFGKDAFIYHAEEDYYTCPQGEILTAKGQWRLTKGKSAHNIKSYSCPITICENCPYTKECLMPSALKNRKGRNIDRMEFEKYVEANKQRVRENKEYYRRRSEIVEHPFGTIKRSWGYTYSRLKSLKKINGEFGLIFLCYNIRRSVSILGVPELIRGLKALKTDFLSLLCPFIVDNGPIIVKSTKIIGIKKIKLDAHCYKKCA
jgi:transposase